MNSIMKKFLWMALCPLLIFMMNGCEVNNYYYPEDSSEDVKTEESDGTTEEPGGAAEDLPDGDSPAGSDTSIADFRNLTYIQDGKEYKMILVDCGSLPPFYIMQTELPANSYLQVGDNYIGVMNSNGDGGIIKAEFRTFLNKLREYTGLPFRLPTPAEWTIAAKGANVDNKNTFSGGNEIDDLAWYTGNSGGSAHEVACKKPNELGLYDMSGNYEEVCGSGEDIYCIDGPLYGGCWNDVASACGVTCWKAGDASAKTIPGTKLKELNAFDAKYIAVRLVFSVPD